MEPPSIIEIGIIFFSLLAIAILSTSESALIAVNKLRLRSLSEKGDSRAQAVERLLGKHDMFFSAVILSGNLFTILATSIGTTLAVHYFGEDWGIALATVLLTFLTVIFGELAPKTFAVTHSESASLALARPLELYIKLITPFIWIFSFLSNVILKIFGVKNIPRTPFVTEEEIKTMLNIGKEEGTLEEDETALLHRVFKFGDLMASETMTPRTEIVAIPSESKVGEVLKIVAEQGYSKYPVYEESIDNITGVLYMKDVLIRMAKGNGIDNLPVEELKREAYYIPENKMVSEMLDEMQKKNFQVAIVVDEYGGTAGLITLEDIIEEIVGGLQDEFEALEAQKDIEIIDERTSVVSGQTELGELGSLMGVDIKSDEFNTVGGFVFGLFGRLPKIGEQVRAHNLRFVVIEMEGRKVAKVKVTRL